MANSFVLWLKEAVGSASFASGMIGTLVGGAITFAVQRFSIAETRRHRAEDRRSVQIAKCSALVFKLIRISSGIYRSIEYFEDRFKLAKEENRDMSQPWAFCMPIANVGNRINFEADELSIFLQIGETKTFNEVCDLDHMYNTFLDLLHAFNERRQSLQFALSAETFDPATGMASGMLNQAQLIAMQPRFFECNDLISSIMGWKANVSITQQAVESVTSVMKLKLSTKIEFKWEGK